VFVQQLCDLAEERRASLRAAAALFVRKVPCCNWSRADGGRQLSDQSVAFGAFGAACCVRSSWFPIESRRSRELVTAR